jgi:replicative DNA helicase
MSISPLIDRIPPQNLEAEQSTLGSMMIDRAALEKGADVLSTPDFYRDAHQIIFDSLVSLAERNEAVDIVTVQEDLRSRGRLEAVGGTEYLMALIDSVPTAANIEYYARIVEEKSILRRMIESCTQIIAQSHGQVDDVELLIDESEKMIFKIAQRRMGDYFAPLRTLTHDAFERIEKQWHDKLTVSGLPTGFEKLDELTAGLQPSDFVIIAGRPSMGKTAFALDIARHVAVQEKKAVAVFSLEMSKEQLTLRLICSESKVDSHRVRTGNVEESDWANLSSGVGRLYEAPIFIDDSSGINALQMRGKCRRLQAECGLGLVVVDYLQLMQSSRRIENRVQEIGDIARSLKGLARELHVPVIALSQLSRAVEQRENKRPMLSDLRESGSIEAEADLVMFLYRHEYYHRDDLDARGKAELIIGKQRNGPVGSLKLAFLHQFTSFANLDEREDD